MSLSVPVDRDQRADDITSSCRHPNPSAGAILSGVSRSHLLFFPLFSNTWPPWRTLQAACVPARRHSGSMNRRWRMLGAVCWALARVAHVSAATAQSLQPASLHRQLVQVAMETGTSTSNSVIYRLGLRKSSTSLSL